jgi:hypothetical protein
MNITLKKPLTSYGARWSENVEVPVHSLSFQVEFDPANRPSFAAGTLASGVTMLGLSKTLITTQLGSPELSILYREKNGTATNLIQRIPLDLCASVSAAGTGEGAIYAPMIYDSASDKYQVTTLYFNVDLTMTMGSIPLDNDQSIEISLQFVNPVASGVLHTMSIYGAEMPLRTNRALAMNSMSVSATQNIKSFDVKDARFMVLPIFDSSYELDYLNFKYANGVTVKKTYDELLADHLRVNDIAITTGAFSSPVGSCVLIEDEIVLPAIEVEMVAKSGKPARLYSLVDLMLPGVDPKTANAGNEQLYT